jgi:hypothetical protein
MAKDTARKIWNKPALNRLGAIKDIAGPNNVGTQGGKS